MKYQFKEGDGSHRDMTIEQCNIVLDRLRNQGYSVRKDVCNDNHSSFWFLKKHGFYPVTNNQSTTISEHNQIPFERWMEILDQNEAVENINPNISMSEQNREHLFESTSQAIKEHQRQCKSILQDCGGSEIRKNQLLNELRKDIDHVNLNQFAGVSRSILEKVKELTAL